MNGFKRSLPYIIISLLSIAIIVAAWFVVPMMFNNGAATNEAGGAFNPATDKGDTDFINSLGGVSETYVGAVSNHTYYSSYDAAYGYIDNEVVGNGYFYNLSAETVEEFSPSNVDITIPSEFLNGAVSVEKVNVTYNLENASAYSTMATAESTNTTQCTTVVYIIKYDYMFKYFVPMPVTGETISKSYYDSVFNSEKFQNCTLQVSVDETATITASAQGQTQTIDMIIKLDQTIMYDDNKIYFYQRLETSIYGKSSIETIYAYIEEDENGYVTCYVKYDENDSWTRGSLSYIGFSDMEELTPFYGNYLDYTYFSKTNYGFALEDENANQYFRQVFGQIWDSMGSMFDIEFELPEDGVDMIARYYVQDGALSGVQSDANIALSVEVDGVNVSMEIDVNAVSTCTNYGTTVVNIDVNK